MTDDDRRGIGEAARHLIRAAALGSLATVMREAGGAPYASLVATATDHDGSPVLLISDLADHTKNLKDDDRVSLLLSGGGEPEDPLAGERLSLQGRLVRSDRPTSRQRYLARHPGAALYADFADFGFYRMMIDRAHLVAGFGRIHWIEGQALTITPSDVLVEAEADIVAHMNEDHADAVALYATRLLGEVDGAWRMTGVDSEGADLRLRERVTRLPFEHRVENDTDVRKELIRLVNKARNA
ncbi:MAG: HugZ family protein [Geminicoccaceae bacterium]